MKKKREAKHSFAKSLEFQLPGKMLLFSLK